MFVLLVPSWLEAVNYYYCYYYYCCYYYCYYYYYYYDYCCYYYLPGRFPSLIFGRNLRFAQRFHEFSRATKSFLHTVVSVPPFLQTLAGVGHRAPRFLFFLGEASFGTFLECRAVVWRGNSHMC